jgi:hypothetical protein
MARLKRLDELERRLRHLERHPPSPHPTTTRSTP